MTPARVRVGVAGLGAMGRFHVESLASGIPRARLVHVADTDAATARRVGEELGVGWSTSVQSMVEHAVDAVVIATPRDCHASQIEVAAHAGKAIFCEKPLAGGTAAACTAVDSAQRAGVILQVGYQRRFDPAFASAHRRIRSGELGPAGLYLSSMRSPCPPPQEALSSGEFRLLVDAGCHELDAARWLMGEIAELAVVAYTNPPSCALLTLTFASGALGGIDLTYLAGYGFDCRCEIVAERATLRIGTRAVDEPEVLAAGSLSRRLEGSYLDRFREAYRLELVSFVDAILTGTPPVVTGQDGLAAQALCDAAEVACAERRSVRLTRGITTTGIAYPAPVSRGEPRASRVTPCSG
jgi:predicted dehydrogenase